MGALYAATTIAFGMSVIVMIGAATFGAGAPSLVGGSLVALCAGLCAIEYLDAAGGGMLSASAWRAFGILSRGTFASLLLAGTVEASWSSKVPFVGGVAGSVLLLGASWRGR